MDEWFESFSRLDLNDVDVAVAWSWDTRCELPLGRCAVVPGQCERESLNAH